MSWEQPSNSSASVRVPSSVSKRYSFSSGTQGSSRRWRASSSPIRVCSFSRWSSSWRAACHSSRLPILCSVIRICLLFVRHFYVLFACLRRGSLLLVDERPLLLLDHQLPYVQPTHL